MQKIDDTLSDEQLIQLYYLSIFNYLNYDLYFISIHDLYKKIIKSKVTINTLKHNNMLSNKNRWNNVFNPINLYKDISKKGIYFPFLEIKKIITFGTHRLWSIYLYGNIFKSKRLLPIMKFKEKQILVFLPKIIYSNYKVFDNIYYNYNGNFGTLIYKKNILWENKFLVLLNIYGEYHELTFLLADIVSMMMYKRNLLFNIREISCPKLYNRINLNNFKQALLKKAKVEIELKNL